MIILKSGKRIKRTLFTTFFVVAIFIFGGIFGYAMEMPDTGLADGREVETEPSPPVIEEGESVSVEMSEDSSPSGFDLTVNASDVNDDILTWSLKSQASNGLADIEGTGTSKTVSYIPEENFNGADSFEIEVSDGNDGRDIITVNVSVNPVNDPPENTEEPTYTGTMHYGNILVAEPGTWNDAKDSTDENLIDYEYQWQRGDNSSDDSPENIIGANFSTYELDEDDSDKYIRIMVIANDAGTPGSESAVSYSSYDKVENNLPVITQGSDTSVTMSEDAIPNEFVLSLDATDSDGDHLTWSIKSQGDNGRASLAGSSTSQAIEYIPEEDYNGSDSFRVKVSDESGGSDVITVNVTIEAKNDAPEITEGTSENASISEDSHAEDFELLLHAEDIDNDTITWSIKTSPSNGSAAVEDSNTGSSQKIKYIPDEDYNGMDSFLVEISDGNGETDSIVINVEVEAVNDPPVNTSDPSFSGIMHNGQILSADPGIWNDDKDTDEAGTITYEYRWQRGDSSSDENPDNISGARDQTYTLTADDNDQYIRVMVRATDSGLPGDEYVELYSSYQLVENVAPVFSFDVPPIVIMSEDSSPNPFNLTLNAIDLDGDDISWEISNQADNGTATVVGTGNSKAIAYTPNEDFYGPDTFEVGISDGNGGSNIFLVFVSIEAVNDKPVNTVLPSISGTMHNGQTITAAPGTWNDDKDNNLLFTISYVYQWQRSENSDSNFEDIAGAEGDSYTLTADDNDKYIRVKVRATDTGTPDLETEVEYSRSQEILNESPVIEEGTTKSITMDEDCEDYSFTLNASDEDGDIISWEIMEDAEDGVVSLSDTISGISQEITYVPYENYFGTDSFKIKISDINGGQDTITVNASVETVNDIPTMTDIEDFSIDEDSTISPEFTVFDVEDDLDSLELSFTTSDTALLPKSNISITGSGADRQINLEPVEDRFGTVQVTITLKDSKKSSDLQTFTMTVDPVNDRPEIGEISDRTIDEDETTGLIGISISDIDNEENDLLISLVSDNTDLVDQEDMELLGTGASRTLEISPIENKNGLANITVTVSDGDLTTEKEFTLTVKAQNDAPTMSVLEDIRIEEDTTSPSIGIEVGDIDNDDNTLIVSASSSNTSMFPRSNIVVGGSGADRTLILTPAENKYGTSNITVIVKDSLGLQESQSFVIMVSEVDDMPVISEISDQTMIEDSNKTISLTVTDIEEDASGNYIMTSIESSNTILFPTDSITISGRGNTREMFISPAADLYGNATVTVYVFDTTGSMNETEFNITVSSVNDKPLFELKTDLDLELMVDEDTGSKTVLGAAINLSTGALNESDQTLSFNVSTEQDELFTAEGQPYINSEGDLTFTPAQNMNGVAIVYASIEDSDGAESNSQNFTININPINDAPVSEDMIIDLDTDEDQSYKGRLKASDIENDNLVYSLWAGSKQTEIISEKGTLSIIDAHEGIFKYVPKENEYGIDTFNYLVNDGELDSEVSTITIKIIGVNDPPVASGNTIATIEDIIIPSYLSAMDIDTTNLQYIIVANPSKGNVILDGPTGVYFYIPHPHESGIDRFTFKVWDGNLYSNTATVTVDILEDNDKPTAYSENINLYEDKVLSGVMKANDIEGDALTYSVESLPSHGSLTDIDSGKGTYTYSPEEGYTGTDSFEFKVNDGEIDSETVEVTITILELNDVPYIIAPNAYTTNEDTELASNFAASDPDGDSLTYSIESESRHGNISITNENTGAFSYTPHDNYSGTDFVTIKVSDGDLFSNIEIRNINVLAVNDLPKAYNQILNTVSGTSISGEFIGYDADGDSLSYSIECDPSNGSVTTDGSSPFIYTPNEGFVGSDAFTFKINDGSGDSNIATITIHVHGEGGNSSGIRGLSNKIMNEDETEIVSFEIGGYTETITASATSGNDWLISDSIPVNYNSATGKWDITLTPNMHKTGKSVIRVTANGQTAEEADTATFILTVLRVNHTPEADSKIIEIDENTVLNEFVTGSDLNGDALVYSLDGVVANRLSHGDIKFNNTTGVYKYTPDENYFGQDGFDFTAKDIDDAVSAKATITINIRRVNKAPEVYGGSIVTDEDMEISSNMTGIEYHGEDISYEIVKNATKGTVVIDDARSGEFTYKPSDNLNGSDAFTFKAVGPTGLESNIARIDITINPVNDAPIAVVTPAETEEDQEFTGFLNATDIEDGSFIFELVENPLKGDLTLNASTGAYTYEPDENENGIDIFTYRVKENAEVFSDITTATITINPVNDAPTAVEQTYHVDEDSILEENFEDLVSDVDDDTATAENEDPQTYMVIQEPQNGELTVDGDSGEFTYRPEENFNGTDYFTFKTVDSGGLSSNVDRIMIIVDPINDRPTITDPTVWTIKEDSSDNKFEFVIGDIEDEETILTLEGTSSNTLLIPNENILFGGSGEDRWIKVTPIDSMIGTAVISIRTIDSGVDATSSGNILSASTALTITVVEVNDLPTINGQASNGKAISTRVTIDEDTTTDPISFTIDDEESGSNLVMTGASNNSSLVKSDGIIFGGTEGNRTVTVTPEADQYGNARITIYASDGDKIRNAYFDLTVNPVNDPPVINPPEDQTINEDTATGVLYFTISDIDSEVEDIVTSAITMDGTKVETSDILVSGNGSERTVKVTPLSNVNGDVVIKLIADDQEDINNIGNNTFTIHIVPVNDKPSIDAIDDITIDEDTSTAQIPVVIGDIDSPFEDLTLTAISGNKSLIVTEGMVFGETEGIKWIKLTPLADEFGSGLITVIVSDGSKTSNTSFNLTVNPINDAPVISAIDDQNILEEGSTNTVTYSVSDIDNDVTELLVTAVSADESVIPVANVALIGNGGERTFKITPLPDENGNIQMELIVKDPGKLTGTSIFAVNITPINDIPSFTKGGDHESDEDAGEQTIPSWAKDIDKGYNNEDSQELTFNVSTDNDGLFSVLPEIDTETGDLTYTAADDKNGLATISVYLTDDGGILNSGKNTSIPVETFTITVNPVNDVPSFTKGADQTVNEDSGIKRISNWAKDISKGPADEDGQTLTFRLTNDNNGLFSRQPTINSNGKLIYTPAVNANGSAIVSVVLSDDGGTERAGDDTADTQTFTISVNSVNDAPIFNITGNQEVNEDCGVKVITGFASDMANGGGSDEDPQTIGFTVTNDNNSLFTAGGQPTVNVETGTLTYTPLADGHGVTTVTVRLSDNGGIENGGVDYTDKTFTITVNSVNDIPTFTSGSDQTVNEDAGTQTVNTWATDIYEGALNESTQGMEFIISSNTNPSLFAADGQPAIDGETGKLTYRPADDANGSATIKIKLKDNGLTANGGVDTSVEKQLVINVRPVNDKPSFVAGANQQVNEDAPTQTIEGWASEISKGLGDESGQTIGFTVTNNNNSLFTTGGQPTVNVETGTLSYSPATDAHGVATVTVRLSDNGGSENGGVDYTEKTFTITVNSVNDIPTFTSGSDQTVNEDAGPQTVNTWAKDIYEGALNESTQGMEFIISSNTNPSLFAADGQPAIDAETGALTYRPTDDANGSATIKIKLKDNGLTENGGIDTSVEKQFDINVTAVNDIPTFTSGSDQTVNEDAGPQTVNTWARDIYEGALNESTQGMEFIISSNTNPSLFAADGQPAIDAETGALTYIPSDNVNGSATIKIKLKDNGLTANGGVDTSVEKQLVINVIPVNDKPSFVAGANQQVNEDASAQTIEGWASEISKGLGDESGQTIGFAVTNDNYSLFTIEGQPIVNVETGTLSYSPVADGHGVATVTVRLSDNGGSENGGVDYTDKTFTITVNSVNDIPTFTKGPDQTVNEDAGPQTVNTWAADIYEGAGNEDGQNLDFIIISNTNTSLFAADGQPAIDGETGNLIYRPADDANGSATIKMKLKDNGLTANGGVDTSVEKQLVINVRPVNDKPSFVAGANQTVNEDAPAQTIVGWASEISKGLGDESGQTIGFTVTNDNNSLFTTGGQPTMNVETGTLTYIPLADAHGEASVTVRLSDNGGSENGGVDYTDKTFTITVNSVNDIPTFTSGSDQTVDEDAGPQTVNTWAKDIYEGAGNEDGQNLDFIIISNTNTSLFASGGQPVIDGETGNLTYRPSDDANGSATITIKLKDNGLTANGGVDTSVEKQFDINVRPVNDIPSFIKGADQTVDEDAGPQTVNAWASTLSKGPANENAQTLEFEVSNDNDKLFTTEGQPEVDSSGKLTFTPAANIHGIATVTVKLVDNGGTENGGIDTTTVQIFTIKVNSVNDIPTFTKGSDQIVLEDAGPQIVSTWATSISSGTDNEGAQILEFTATNNNKTLFTDNGQPEIDPLTGTLTFTPADDEYGTAIVKVLLSDDGQVLNGGDNTSEEAEFTITLTPVNDAPGFTKGSDLIAREDAGLQSLEAWASGMTKGPLNESSQTLLFSTSTNNDNLFTSLGKPSINPITGELIFIPEIGAYGDAVVTVSISDDGGSANLGVDKSETQTFTIHIVNDEEMVLKGTIYNAETRETIEGATINLLDLSGTILEDTISHTDGSYEFTGLSEGRYIVEVIHPSYSHNSRMTEISLEENALGIITEDFLMADFTLILSANPTSILGDGIETTILTAEIRDKNNIPLSGVSLKFGAEKGTFLGNTTLITDENGIARITYQSEDLDGIEELNIPVIVEVNDPVSKLYGSDQIFVTFAPGFIEGIVTDGTVEYTPVEGALVTVYKDFDGDGITDFSFTQTTGVDGKYKIAIPKGNTTYDILITKSVKIGNKIKEMTFRQKASVGDITGVGNEQFSSENIATGVLMIERTDGTIELLDNNILGDNIIMEIVDSNGLHVSIPDDNIDYEKGIFTTNNLDPGTYTVNAKFKFEDGRTIIFGRTEIIISSDGEMHIGEILIDPYGTITVKGSETKIEGATVELYYADTNRNQIAGLSPGTLVELPEIENFPPSDNVNPQLSDEYGYYAYMVYPQTDYYIVAKKSGFRRYISDTISVYEDIVLHDIEMTRESDDDEPLATGERDLAISISTSEMKAAEESDIILTLDYQNKSEIQVGDITIKVTLPEGLVIQDLGEGTQSGNIVRWHMDSMDSLEKGIVELVVKSTKLDSAQKYMEIKSAISSSEELSNIKDDTSKIKIMIYSNEYTMIHERYIKGYPAGDFRPFNNITRAEVSAIFARLLDLDVSDSKSSYRDLSSDHWATGYINAVSKEGLMNGYVNGTFAADNPITRGEFATIIARYFGIERSNLVKPIEMHFTDIENNWAMSSIEEIFRYSISNGYSDGTFKPQQAILRTEAITMINRMLYRGPVDNDISHFTDVEKEDWYFGQVEESGKTHEFKINPDGSENIIKWIDDDLK